MKKKTKPTLVRNPSPGITNQINNITARHFWLLLIIITILGFTLRAIDLRADPPPDLSWSFAPYTDESLNTYSARNFVLYGKWQTDDFLPFVVYPLVNIINALIFKLLGIGFVQVKILSLIAGMLTIFLIALFLREETGNTSALLTGLILSTCYPLLMYNRLGLVEPVQILFLILTGLFWLKGLKRPYLMIFSGFFAAGTVLLIKISAIFIIPTVFIMFLGEFIKYRFSRKLLPILLFFITGVAVAALCWFLAVFLPYRHQYIRYILRHSSESPAGHPKTLPAYLLNTFTFGLRSKLIPRMLWVGTIGYLSLPWLALTRKTVFRYTLLWFIFGLFMLGYMNYRPTRYEIILLPCLIIGASAALNELLTNGTILPPFKPTISQTLIYSLWLWPPVLQLLFYITKFRLYPQPSNELGVLILALTISLTVAFTIRLVLGKIPAGIALQSPPLRIITILIFFLLIFRLDFNQFSVWFNNRTYNLITYSRQLDQLLPPDAVIAGPWAPPLMIESKKRAIAITDWANINDPVNRFGLTHLVIGEGETDHLLIKKLNPQLLQNSSPLIQFRIRGQLIRVITLPAS